MLSAKVGDAKMGFREVSHLVERKEEKGEEVRTVASRTAFTNLRRKYSQTGALL